VYKFKPIDLKQNQQYFDQVINLFNKNRDLWIDDLWQPGNYTVQFIQEVLSGSPWFQVVLNDKDEFMGFVWLNNWMGKEPYYNGVQIQAMMERKFWGKETEKAFSCLLNKLFNETCLNRVQMEIDETNILACKLAERMCFKLEGIIRNATIKDGKPVNYKLFSILKGEYNNERIIS